MYNLEELQHRLSEMPFVNKMVMDKNELTIEVLPSLLKSAMWTLKKDFAFEQCVDICGVDYLLYGEVCPDVSEIDTLNYQKQRFAVVYHLLSISENYRLRVRVFTGDNDTPYVDSICDVWQSASWCEREAFDLCGITFIGHPDLRRILTDYGFMGHPLRKDFPLSGSVEMFYDEETGKVTYRPVTIELREITPRIIKDDRSC
jgi:NADH-quinone oxidoreductase subunit C